MTARLRLKPILVHDDLEWVIDRLISFRRRVFHEGFSRPFMAIRLCFAYVNSAAAATDGGPFPHKRRSRGAHTTRAMSQEAGRRGTAVPRISLFNKQNLVS